MSKDKLHNKTKSVNQSDSENRSHPSGWLPNLKKYWWAVGIIALLSLGALGAGLKYLEEDANRQMSGGQLKTDGTQETSLLNSINPFLADPPPAPTPQLATEYIYAGGKLLAVENANANAAPPADLAVWRPNSNGTGTWFVMGSSGSQQTSVPWGANTDTTVPGDYDGDGKTDFSVFRPSTGYWYVQNSSAPSTTTSYYFGASTDKVAPADYDGDGRTDAAVFRPSNGFWYIQRSSDNGLTAVLFGLGSDIPSPADFDGDGKADIAVWRGSTSSFYISRSSDNVVQTITLGLQLADDNRMIALGAEAAIVGRLEGGEITEGEREVSVEEVDELVDVQLPQLLGEDVVQAINFNKSSDKPVAGDYDGDGKADGAVWRAADNQWWILRSSDGATEVTTFGISSSDIPVQNDYDGDGRVDMAAWRASNGYWYILQSSRKGQPDHLRQTQWGQNGDIPVPAFYRR